MIVLTFTNVYVCKFFWSKYTNTRREYSLSMTNLSRVFFRTRTREHLANSSSGYLTKIFLRSRTGVVWVHAIIGKECRNGANGAWQKRKPWESEDVERSSSSSLSPPPALHPLTLQDELFTAEVLEANLPPVQKNSWTILHPSVSISSHCTAATPWWEHRASERATLTLLLKNIVCSLHIAVLYQLSLDNARS